MLKLVGVIFFIIYMIFFFILGDLFAFGFESTFYKIFLYSLAPFILFFIALIISPKGRKEAVKEFDNNWFLIATIPIWMPAVFAGTLGVLLAPYVMTFNGFVGKQDIKVIKGTVSNKDNSYLLGTKQRTYNLTLNTKNKKRILGVTEEIYKSVENGDDIDIKMKTGCLGIKYILKKENIIIKD